MTLAGDALVLLADPYSFATERLLEEVERLRPGLPVLGGLVSAAAAGGGVLFRDGDVVSRRRRRLLDRRGRRSSPASPRAPRPVGAEMTITAAHGNVDRGARVRARARAAEGRRSPSCRRASGSWPPRA